MTFTHYDISQRAYDGLFVTWAARPVNELPATLSSVWTAIGVSEDRQTAVSLTPSSARQRRKGE